MDKFSEKYTALKDAMDKAREEHHKAQAALDAAMDAANEAEGKMLDARADFVDFMAQQAEALREKLLDSEIFNAKLQLTTQSGFAVTTDLSQISIDARCVVDSDNEGFRISVDAGNNHPARYVTLGIYETPAQVEEAIGNLREAIRRGDKAFTFGLPLTAEQLMEEQCRITKWLDSGELSPAERAELEVQYFKNGKVLETKLAKIFGDVRND